MCVLVGVAVRRAAVWGASVSVWAAYGQPADPGAMVGCGRARCARYRVGWARGPFRVVLAQWRACAARRAGVPGVL